MASQGSSGPDANAPAPLEPKFFAVQLGEVQLREVKSVVEAQFYEV